MQNPYKCCFDIDYRNGDVRIRLKGDGQEVDFIFMIAFYSIPWFFAMLIQLWKGITNKTELDGFGFAVRYNFTVEEKHLLIEHLTYDEKDQPVKYHFKFDFEKFVKAVDKGFSDLLEEQYSKGVLPIEVEEFSHPLSMEVLEEYNQFTNLIRGQT